jgi:hypothetical protein
MSDEDEVGQADRICIEAVVNGYIVEVYYPDKVEKMIAWTPRVVIYLLAGLLGYDVQRLEMTGRKSPS